MPVMLAKDELRKIVESILSANPKCNWHCGKDTRLRLYEIDSRLVGAYVCDEGYVSRLIEYTNHDDLEWFKGFVSGNLGNIGNVSDRDIRVATRYSWDLGLEGKYSGAVLKEIYWTQNYGKNLGSKVGYGLFVCSNCGSFFTKKNDEPKRICGRCGKY